jgi:hypothetical protein
MDPKNFPKPAVFSEVKKEVGAPREEGRKHSLIPTHAVETMQAWDTYRADKQALYAKMSPEKRRECVMETIGIPSSDEAFKALIANLPDLDELDRKDLEARKAREARKAHEKKWYIRLLRKIQSILCLR